MSEAIFFEDSEKERHFDIFGESSIEQVVCSAVKALECNIPNTTRPSVKIDGTMDNSHKPWENIKNANIYITLYFDARKRADLVRVCCNSIHNGSGFFSDDFLDAAFSGFAGNLYTIGIEKIKYLETSVHADELVKLMVQERKRKMLPSYYTSTLRRSIDNVLYYPSGVQKPMQQWIDYLGIKPVFNRIIEGIGVCEEKGKVSELTPEQQKELFQKTPKSELQVYCISNMLDYDDPESDKPERKQVKLKTRQEEGCKRDQFVFEFKVNPGKVETKQIRDITISIPPNLSYLNGILQYSLGLDLSDFFWEVKSK